MLHAPALRAVPVAVLENNEFFFSYTYNLHQTLQANLMGPASTSQEGDKNRDPFSSMVIWNHYLTKV